MMHSHNGMNSQLETKARLSGLGRLFARLGSSNSGAAVASHREIDCMELESRVLLSAAPLSPEALVNTATANTQETQAESPQAVASDANGDFVVVWTSQGQDGGGQGVYAQRYNSNGLAQGSEFQVNSTPAGDQTYGSVAMDSSGNFVVTWSSNGQDGDLWGVYAQRYNSSGTALGGEFLVNTSDTSGDQRFSTVALNDSGDFVIASSTGVEGNSGIRAQRYDSSGAAVGGEIQVNTETNNDQIYSSIAMHSAGTFVITWTSDIQDGSGLGIYAQRFNADGTYAGTEFRVNSTTSSDQQYSRVALDDTGNFVITWQSNHSGSWSIYAQRYDSAGTTQGGEFLVNSTPANDQQFAAVTMDGNGNFVIVWESNLQDGSGRGIYLKQYDSSGAVLTGELLVNETTSGDQRYPSVAAEDNGDFVVVWSGNGSGDASGVFSRRYIHNTAPTLDTTKSPALTAINEDAGAPSGAVGTLVSSLVDFASPSGQVDNVTDPDAGAQLGIAVTAADATNGTWWYSINNGSNWFALGSVASNNARLLAADANTRLYFQPNPNYNGTIASAITFRAWDRRTGSNGATADTSSNGGGTAFSSATDTASLVVNAVNDAPVNTVPGAQSTSEDTPRVFSSGNGNQISISDVDAASNSVRVTLTGTNGVITLNGTTGLSFTSGDGTADATMIFTGNVTNINNALNGLSFSPTAGFNGAASLQIVTNDQGNTGSGGSLSDTDTVNITVNAVNDAPVLSSSASPALSSQNEDSGVPSGAVGTLVNTLVDFASPAGQVDNVTDVDSGALLGIAVTAADTTNGVWWYSTNNGSSWFALGAVANNNARLLSADANTRLYFQPNANYNGTQAGAITFCAWDRTSGSNGALADASTNGGTTAFSTATDTASLTINAVNDAPVNAVPGAQSTSEDTTLVFSSGNGNQVSISDVDAASGSVRVTLTGTNGVITLNGTTGLSFTSGDGTADATMIFTGNVTSINNALNGLGFSPTANFNGAASLQIATNDQANTGSGGAQSDTDTVAITVNGVNDAPLNNVPGAQTTSEDVALVFSAGNGNQISISDLDAGSNPVQVTLTGTNGTMTLASLAGLSFSSGDGTSDATMTFTGTVTNINTALNGMSFLSTLNYSGAAGLQINTNDQGNTGSGGALSDSDSVSITVNSVNDAPVNTVPAAQSTSEGTPLVFSSPISIADVDAGAGLVEVMLTSTNGTLTLAGTTGLAFSSGDGTADATMTFTGTISDINTALNGLTFSPAPDFAGAASLQIITNDQGNSGGPAQSDSDTIGITISGVNDGPVNSVPGAQATNEDTALVFSIGGGNAISISDVDAGSNPVQVTLTAANGTVTLASLAGLSFSSGDGASDATMTFTGTMADVNATLEGLVFSPTANYNGAASLQIITNDQGNSGAGGPLTDTDTVNITVNAVNDAPVNTVPGPQSTNEDTPLVFSSAGGNQILIADLDAASPVRVTLTAANGTLTLAGTAGLSFSSGDGTADATMTFTGTVASINTALDGLVFSPLADFNGAASLQIVTNDQGNTGAGGPLTDTDTVSITVNAINDAPLNSVPGPQLTNEDTPLVFSTAVGNRISVSDVDAGLSPVQVTLTATNGTLTLAGTSGLTFSSGDGTADAVMTFTGSVVDINAALDGMTFQAPLDYNGPASVQIVIDDQGTSGAGGNLSDNDTVSITVNAVNDAPVLSVPAAQTTSEDTPLVFSAAGGNSVTVADLDAGSGTLAVTLTVANGTLTLGSTAGLIFTTGDGTDDATMTFIGVLADLNVALEGLTYLPNLDYNGLDALAASVSDQGNTGLGGPLVDADTVSIGVNDENDAPVNSVPAAQATDEDVPLVFSTTVGNAITVGDLDAAAGELQITLSVSSGTLTLASLAGLTFSTGDGVADGTLVFTGTQPAINAALNGLVYLPAANFNGLDQLQLTTNDQGNTGAGGPLTDVDTVDISVNAVNDAPLLAVPGAQTINEDLPLVFSTAGGNGIALTDVDSGAGLLQLTLAASQGTLSLASVAGLTFNVGDGFDDAAIDVLGTLVDLNAALEGLRFTPDANYNGPAQVQAAVSDLGNSGTGGALTDAGIVDVDVIAINDAPTITMPAAQQQMESTTLIFSTATGNAIVLGDVEAVAPVEVTITATGGTFTLAATTGLTVVSGSGVAGTQIVVQGTLADINAALDGLTYDWSQGMDTELVISVNDLGQGGAGGALITSSSIALSPPPLIPPPSTDTEMDTDSDAETLVPGAVQHPSMETVDSRDQVVSDDPGRHHRHDRTSGVVNVALVIPVNIVVDDDSGDSSEHHDTSIEAAVANRLTALARMAPGMLQRGGLLDAGLLWNQLDALAEQIAPAGSFGNFTVGAAAGMTAVFSAGYVAWCLRSGALLASALSSLPMWRNFDALPVLEFWEKKNAGKSQRDGDEETEEPLEQLVKNIL